VLLSAFLLTTLLLSVFGAIYGKNGTWVFFDSGLTSFLNGFIFWFNVTYGQYVLLYAGLLYMLCLGAAALAFVLSRFSRNLITLILKLIPLFAALVFFCVFGLNDMRSGPCHRCGGRPPDRPAGTETGRDGRDVTRGDSPVWHAAIRSFRPIREDRLDHHAPSDTSVCIFR
jgi:hypothetical protein